MHNAPVFTQHGWADGGASAQYLGCFQLVFPLIPIELDPAKATASAPAKGKLPRWGGGGDLHGDGSDDGAELGGEQRGGLAREFLDCLHRVRSDSTSGDGRELQGGCVCVDS